MTEGINNIIQVSTAEVSKETGRSGHLNNLSTSYFTTICVLPNTFLLMLKMLYADNLKTICPYFFQFKT